VYKEQAELGHILSSRVTAGSLSLGFVPLRLSTVRVMGSCEDPPSFRIVHHRMLRSHGTRARAQAAWGDKAAGRDELSCTTQQSSLQVDDPSSARFSVSIAGKSIPQKARQSNVLPHAYTARCPSRCGPMEPCKMRRCSGVQRVGGRWCGRRHITQSCTIIHAPSTSSTTSSPELMMQFLTSRLPDHRLTRLASCQ
jgi:hypothetical protein